MKWAERAKSIYCKRRALPFAAIPTPRTVGDDVAALQKKSDDLDAIQKAVEAAATVGAPLWLSYIFLMFYIAIAAAAVSHKDLLLENPVELPFLSIKLPLKAFFVLAPILFFIVHAYVLAHFALLADKAKSFHNQLKAKVESHDAREGLRQQLPINIFVQFLAGPGSIRQGPFSVLLWGVTWATLVAGPVLVLLLLQVQFLPYHDSRVSWVHRVMLVADLGLIWWLWMRLLSGRDDSLDAPASLWDKFKGGFLTFARKIAALPLTVFLAEFSILVAVFPGEWREWPYRLAPGLELEKTTALAFGAVNPFKARITGSWPVNSLRLPEFDIYDGLKAKPADLAWKTFVFSFKDRHLENADFRSARFDNVDMRGATLIGAWLDRAQMDGANLEQAKLQWASLEETQLRGASLAKAQLHGAWLNEADLTAASLDDAQLQGAALRGANLQGATLFEAFLQGSDFMAALLYAADLRNAQLQGARMASAQLQGALLYATMGGLLSDYGPLYIGGANFDSASLWRTNFGNVQQPIPLATTNDVHWDPIYGRRWKYKEYMKLSLPPNPRELFEGRWNDTAYDNLKRAIEGLRPSQSREEALKRIQRLDCKKDAPDLAPCDPKAKAPTNVADWRRKLSVAPSQAAVVEERIRHIRSTICSGEENAVYVWRGIARNLAVQPLPFADRDTLALVDALLSPGCSFSVTVTDAERAALRALTIGARTGDGPAPAPKK
jgi:hypothetical protein